MLTFCEYDVISVSLNSISGAAAIIDDVAASKARKASSRGRDLTDTSRRETPRRVGCSKGEGAMKEEALKKVDRRRRVKSLVMNDEELGGGGGWDCEKQGKIIIFSTLHLYLPSASHTQTAQYPNTFITRHHLLSHFRIF